VSGIGNLRGNQELTSNSIHVLTEDWKNGKVGKRLARRTGMFPEEQDADWFFSPFGYPGNRPCKSHSAILKWPPKWTLWSYSIIAHLSWHIQRCTKICIYRRLSLVGDDISV